MQPIQDERLALSTRVVETRDSHVMSVTVMSAFRLDGDGYLPEAELWSAAAPLAEKGVPLDWGFAKPEREFLIDSLSRPVALSLAEQGPLTTADAAWLEKGGPGFPKDFDESWFQQATPSQRGGGKGFEPGKEFSLAGIDPAFTGVKGSFPGQAPWVRLEQDDGRGGVALTQVELTADTAWFFPEDGKGVLVWHGAVPVDDGEASEVAVVRAGLDGQPPAEDVREDVAAAMALTVPPPLPAPPLVPKAPEPLAQFQARTAADAAMDVEEDADDEDFEEVDEPEDGETPEAEVPAPPALSPVAAARRDFEDTLALIQSSAAMADPEGLAMFNAVMEAHGIEPVTEADFQAHLASGVQATIQALRDIPDDELWEVVRVNADEEMTEASAIREVTDSLINLGLDEGEAGAIAKDAFADYPALSENPDGAEIVDTLLGGDWTGMPVTPEEINAAGAANSEAAEDAALAAAKAELDEFLIELFGKDFDAITDPDDDTVPTIDSGDGIRRACDDDEAAEKAAAAFDAILSGDDSSAEQDYFAALCERDKTFREIVDKLVANGVISAADIALDEPEETEMPQTPAVSVGEDEVEDVAVDVLDARSSDTEDAVEDVVVDSDAEPAEDDPEKKIEDIFGDAMR